MAGAVAASFALPSDYAPYRMRNEYSTEETALFKVFEEHPATVGVTGGVNPLLRTDQHLEFIFQDPLCNRITYVRNPTGATWQYQWVMARNTDGSSNTLFPITAGSQEPLVPSHAVANTAFRPHGDILFAKNDNGMTGMWIDSPPLAGNSTVTVTLSVAPPVGPVGSIILTQWINGSWRETQTLPAVAGQLPYVFNIPLATSGYFGVIIRGMNATQNVGVIQAGVCDCYGHLPAPYLVPNANSIESCRILGHSILVKNITSNQNKQGAIVGIQPGKSRYWYSFASSDGASDSFSIVRDYAGASSSRVLETGLYGFVKPTEEGDLRFREPFTITNVQGVATSTVWTFAESPILNTAYIVVAAQCNNTTPQNLLVRTDCSGEYETGNQFFNVDKPRAEPSDWRDGMEALASMQQFYENPTHWKRILQTIGSVASVGGRILSLFGPKGAAVGVPLSMAGDLVNRGFQ